MSARTVMLDQAARHLEHTGRRVVARDWACAAGLLELAAVATISTSAMPELRGARILTVYRVVPAGAPATSRSDIRRMRACAIRWAVWSRETYHAVDFETIRVAGGIVATGEECAS